MKTNAIIRIIIWSIVIVMLVGILNSFLFGWKLNKRYDDTPAETFVPARVPEGNDDTPTTRTAKVIQEVNISLTGGDTENTIGILYPGDTVEYYRITPLDGQDWVRISAPQEGWVPASALDLSDGSRGSAGSQIANADGTVPSDSIQKISIQWVAGDIHMIPVEGIDEIRFSEDSVGESAYPMVWKQSGNELKIHFCKDTIKFPSFGVTADISKDLLIEVPFGWICQELDIDAAATNLHIQELLIREVNLDGAAGTCEFVDCTIGEMDMDTAAGDVSFTGSLNSLDFDSATASFNGVFSNVPKQIDMDGMSGDLDLTLPENAGFTLTMDSMSSHFRSDFSYSETRKGTYVSGDGACHIDMDAMSGDVYIRKGPAANP